MKAKVRTFNGTTSPEVTQRETDHRKLAREAAAEGFVLLKTKIISCRWQRAAR